MSATSIAVPFVALPALELVSRHDNDFTVAIYLNPSDPHAGSFRGTESPCHVLLPEYGWDSSHGQEFHLSRVI
jgi:hypothetical protein